MGRRKIGLELIINKTSRNLTYQKRKKGLEKKANELSTLCEIKLCMIIYGPKDGDKADEPTIWPDTDTAHCLIDKYNARSDDDRRSRTHDLTFFFKDLTKKVQMESAKLRKQNQEAKYPTWDQRYDRVSSVQLKQFAALLGSKIEKIKQRLKYVKSTRMIPLDHTHTLSFLGKQVITTTDEQQQQQSARLMQTSLVRKSSLKLEIIEQPQQPFIGNFPVDHHLVTGPPHHQMMMLNSGAAINDNNIENQNAIIPLGIGMIENTNNHMLVSSNTTFVDPHQQMCYFVPMATPTNYFHHHHQQQYPTTLMPPPPSPTAAATYQMHASQGQQFEYNGSMAHHHNFHHLPNRKYEK